MSDVVVRSTKPYPRETHLPDPEVVYKENFDGGISKFECYQFRETLYTYLEFDPERSFLIFTPPELDSIELVLQNLGAIDEQLPDYIRDDLQDMLRVNE